MAAISSKALKPFYAENKFRYNGKELQNKEFSDGTGLEDFDYGARMQDPQIGRWMTIDPLGEKFYSLSPFAYVANNPILINDPTGRDWTITMDVDKNGVSHFHILFTGAVVDETSDHKGQADKLAQTITKQFQTLFNQDKSKDDKDPFTVDAKAEIRSVNSENDVAKNETVFKIEDAQSSDLKYQDKNGNIGYAGGIDLNGKEIAISEGIVPYALSGNANKTITHEIGHSGGLRHPEDDSGFFGWLLNKPGYGLERKGNNFMFSGGSYGQNGDQLNKTPTGPTRSQLYHIYELYQSNLLNRKDINPTSQ